MDTGFKATLSGDKKGIVLTAFLPFDGDEGFTEEAEGNSYEVPLKARGDNGVLATTRENIETAKKNPLKFPADFPPAYDTLPVIKDGKKDMYVVSDGRLTTDPYVDENRRNIKSVIVKMPRQASAKRTYGTRINDANIVWPDGMIRKLAIDIKANNPQTPEDFEASKSQATQKRQATVARQIVESDSAMLIPPLIRKWQAGGKSTEVILVNLENMDLLEGLKELQSKGQFTDIVEKP